jgi:hypothetical protein
MTTGVPRLQLEGLGGRATPRAGSSRQQTLQRVFKGLDDDDDDMPKKTSTARGDTSIAGSGVNESLRITSYSSVTPRASQAEIERRRKVMFDSEDDDTPSHNKRSSKVCSHPGWPVVLSDSRVCTESVLFAFPFNPSVPFEFVAFVGDWFCCSHLSL